jgi:hypothetical protein
MKMRYETGTFELRDNDVMMRELSSAETDEVVGGLALALFTEVAVSGTGSSLTISGPVNLATTDTSAFVSLSQMISATGTQNLLALTIATFAST